MGSFIQEFAHCTQSNMSVCLRQLCLNRNRFLVNNIRTLSTGTMLRGEAERLEKNFKRLKEKQKQFRIDDGLRVHEKMGSSDKILQTFTLGLVLIGFFEWCRVVWTLAYPNWETFLTKK